MFAGFLVVLLVEPAEQVLEYGSHGVVVEARDPHCLVLVGNRIGAEIHCRGQEPLDQCVEHTATGEPGGLVSELELFEDVLDVGREPVEVGVEVVAELLLRGGASQVPKREWRCVVELLAGCLLQRPSLVGDVGFVETLFRSMTCCFVGSSTASRRRITVMGRMTSRYFPRT